MASKQKKSSRLQASPTSKKISRTRKPSHMTIEEWQTSLRREFGRKQKFKIRNTGTEPIFSEFRVTNPESGGIYRVAIRGVQPGKNYCSCPDFTGNTLGTCKHIEFTLAKLETRRGGKKALQGVYQPKYSEIFLRYGARREVLFGAGTTCPPSLRRLAAKYFDETGSLKSAGYRNFNAFLKKNTESESS